MINFSDGAGMSVDAVASFVSVLVCDDSVCVLVCIFSFAVFSVIAFGVLTEFLGLTVERRSMMISWSARSITIFSDAVVAVVFSVAPGINVVDSVVSDSDVSV